MFVRRTADVERLHAGVLFHDCSHIVPLRSASGAVGHDDRAHAAGSCKLFFILFFAASKMRARLAALTCDCAACFAVDGDEREAHGTDGQFEHVSVA